MAAASSAWATTFSAPVLYVNERPEFRSWFENNVFSLLKQMDYRFIGGPATMWETRVLNSTRYLFRCLYDFESSGFKDKVAFNYIMSDTLRCIGQSTTGDTLGVVNKVINSQIERIKRQKGFGIEGMRKFLQPLIHNWIASGPGTELLEKAATSLALTKQAADGVYGAGVSEWQKYQAHCLYACRPDRDSAFPGFGKDTQQASSLFDEADKEIRARSAVARHR